MFDDPKTAHLVRAAQRGDRQAREDLFARYLPRVRQIAALRAGWRIKQFLDLEDLVQDALLSAIQALDRFEPRSEGSFRNWLARYVETEISRHARRAGAQKRGRGNVRRFADLDSVLLHTSILAGREPTPSQLAAAQELSERIEEALLEMPEHYREVIILRQICEMTYAEIAREMGFAQETSARMACSRALQKLKSLIGYRSQS